MQLVYLSPVQWTSFAQRPHRFVEWYHSTTGAKVAWVDPYPTRLPSWRDLARRGGAVQADNGGCPNWLTIIRPKALPIEPLPGSGFVNKIFWREIFRKIAVISKGKRVVIGIGKPSALALQALDLFGDSDSFYDAMDDFSAFYQGLSNRSMAEKESQIMSRVANAMVSSATLYARWSATRPVSLVRNACSPAALPPAGQRRLPDGRPVLGYVGTIGQWFDWELVRQIASVRPGLVVRVIGPMHNRPFCKLPSNVEILPACEHKAAMVFMAQFSVGLIPFKITTLTRSVDPIKYYEYRALGIPVMSSSFGEMSFHGDDKGAFLIPCGMSGGEIGAIIDAALCHRDAVQSIEKFRADNSWEARFSKANLVT